MALKENHLKYLDMRKVKCDKHRILTGGAYSSYAGSIGLGSGGGGLDPKWPPRGAPLGAPLGGAPRGAPLGAPRLQWKVNFFKMCE